MYSKAFTSDMHYPTADVQAKFEINRRDGC